MATLAIVLSCIWALWLYGLWRKKPRNTLDDILNHLQSDQSNPNVNALADCLIRYPDIVWQVVLADVSSSFVGYIDDSKLKQALHLRRKIFSIRGNLTDERLCRALYNAIIAQHSNEAFSSYRHRSGRNTADSTIKIKDAISMAAATVICMLFDTATVSSVVREHNLNKIFEKSDEYLKWSQSLITSDGINRVTTLIRSSYTTLLEKWYLSLSDWDSLASYYKANNKASAHALVIWKFVDLAIAGELSRNPTVANALHNISAHIIIPDNDLQLVVSSHSTRYPYISLESLSDENASLLGKMYAAIRPTSFWNNLACKVIGAKLDISQYATISHKLNLLFGPMSTIPQFKLYLKKVWRDISDNHATLIPVEHTAMPIYLDGSLDVDAIHLACMKSSQLPHDRRFAASMDTTDLSDEHTASSFLAAICKMDWDESQIHPSKYVFCQIKGYDIRVWIKAMRENIIAASSFIDTSTLARYADISQCDSWINLVNMDCSLSWLNKHAAKNIPDVNYIVAIFSRAQDDIFDTAVRICLGLRQNQFEKIFQQWLMMYPDKFSLSILQQIRDEARKVIVEVDEERLSKSMRDIYHEEGVGASAYRESALRELNDNPPTQTYTKSVVIVDMVDNLLAQLK